MKCLVLLCGFVLLLIVGCKKAEIKKLEDPCNDRTRTSADFKIMEEIGFNDPTWQSYETDTIYTGLAGFKSTFKADSVLHTWYIGAGIYKTQNVSLDFRLVRNRPVSILITHVVRNLRDSLKCTDDDGYDSVTKVMVLVNKSRIYGKYFCTNIQNKHDTVTLSIDSTIFRDNFGEPITAFCNFGINRCCNQDDGTTYGYKKWSFVASDMNANCGGSYGLVYISNDTAYFKVNKYLTGFNYKTYNYYSLLR
jgi:hypothetical protein